MTDSQSYYRVDGVNMVARPHTDRTARLGQLTSAAAAVFAERGVANTAVSDIVRAAGVAQGTFYLYFKTKDEVVLAVVEQMVQGMVSAIETAVAATGASGVDKLLSLRDVFASSIADPTATELADFVHTPENRALHDRLAELLTPRLLPLVESIVAQGVAEGSFDVPDTRAAAWFVLGGMQSAELSVASTAEMPAALAAATSLALRALGHREGNA